MASNESLKKDSEKTKSRDFLRGKIKLSLKIGASVSNVKYISGMIDKFPHLARTRRALTDSCRVGSGATDARLGTTAIRSSRKAILEKNDRFSSIVLL